MKIKLFTVVVLAVFMLQFAKVNANTISIAPAFAQIKPPPPPPHPRFRGSFRHHRHYRRAHGRISIHLPPHPPGPPLPPPPRP